MMVDAIPNPGANKREGIIDLAGPTNHVPNGILDVCVVMPNPMHGTIIITSRTPVGAPP